MRSVQAKARRGIAAVFTVLVLGLVILACVGWASETYLTRGNIYQRKGEKEKAIADFKEVLELSNDPVLRKLAEEQL